MSSLNVYKLPYFAETKAELIDDRASGYRPRVSVIFLVEMGRVELPPKQSYLAGMLEACLPARRPENMQSEIEMPLAK